MSELKIGLFGGSFDPIHNGHLAVINYMIDSLSLDKLFVIPSYQSFANKQFVANSKQRLVMADLLTSINPKVSVSGFEINNQQVNYTVNTAAYFRNKFPHAAIYWILGSDQAIKLANWHAPKQILNLVNLAIYPRGNIALPKYFDFDENKVQVVNHVTDKAFGEIILCRNAPQQQIQSSQIKYNKTFDETHIPKPILNYIINHHLYET